jgi:archaellum component FlaC
VGEKLEKDIRDSLERSENNLRLLKRIALTGIGRTEGKIRIEFEELNRRYERVSAAFHEICDSRTVGRYEVLSKLQIAVRDVELAVQQAHAKHYAAQAGKAIAGAFSLRNTGDVELA